MKRASQHGPAAMNGRLAVHDTNCNGCGSLLDADPGEARRAVEELLESTRTDNTALGRVCPLCGHRTSEPVSHRKTVQFGLLVTLLVAAGLLLVVYYMSRETERQRAVHEAMVRLNGSADVAGLLGAPLTIRGDVTGQVRQDETGWQEARLVIPLRGEKSVGVARVIGGRQSGPWEFTTLEVLVAPARKRIDLIAGRIVDFDSEGYVDTHTQAAMAAEFTRTDVPPPIRGPEYPCLTAPAGVGGTPRLGTCEPRLPVTSLGGAAVDEFLVDLRYGKFILRQTDLSIRDGDLEVPLTRTYTSNFWMHYAHSNAFGLNSTHDFDVAPVGTRNPYTYLQIILPDGDFLQFPRVSRGSGYADAVYQHTETSSPFYGALLRWTGQGWATELRDGSRINFPESYSAINMAQGAPVELVDAQGRTIRLLRDRQRNLQAIETPNRQRITLTTDVQGRVARAEDQDHRWVDYRYGPSGALADVSYADGRARHYAYDGSVMTSVRDEAGRVLVDNSYRRGKLVRQTYANGQTFGFRYDIAPSDRFATRAVVETPDGVTHEIRTEEFVPRWMKGDPR